MTSKQRTIMWVVLFVLTFIGGVVAGGLYVSLTKYPPKPQQNTSFQPYGTPRQRPRMAGPQPIAPLPNATGERAMRRGPFAPSAQQPMEGVGVQPGTSPQGAPRVGFPMTQRSPEFREARRAIFKEGKEPDWNKFQGEELDLLKRAWERHQRRQEMMKNKNP